ncbi:hypothetical protein FB451DRAFT_1395662 [Mycena latifolia]|nr:hypothetical protein FB451DRAFT_1395662 [Mycena latifolia]
MWERDQQPRDWACTTTQHAGERAASGAGRAGRDNIRGAEADRTRYGVPCTVEPRRAWQRYIPKRRAECRRAASVRGARRVKAPGATVLGADAEMRRARQAYTARGTTASLQPVVHQGRYAPSNMGYAIDREEGEDSERSSPCVLAQAVALDTLALSFREARDETTTRRQTK